MCHNGIFLVRKKLVTFIYILLNFLLGFPGQASHLPIQETRVQSLGQEEPLEEKVATHSSILAWTRIPRTEEPGRLQFLGSQSQT